MLPACSSKRARESEKAPPNKKLKKVGFATNDEKLQVLLRIRPNSGSDAHRIDIHKNRIKIESQSGIKNYDFSHIFTEDASQQQVYERVAAKLLDGVFKNKDGLIFAYGKTGTGKTFTINGEGEDARGVLPRILEDLFEKLKTRENSELLTVNVSYMEIFLGKIYDLLVDVQQSQQRPHLKKTQQGSVQNLEAKKVSDSKEALEWFEFGQKNRTKGENDINEHSSRSHAFFTISIKSKCGNTTKLSVIDLAGAERTSNNIQDGTGTSINSSMLVFGRVITALLEKKNGKQAMVPWNGSVLTSLMKPYFVGGGSATMVTTIDAQKIIKQNVVQPFRHHDVLAKASLANDIELVSRVNSFQATKAVGPLLGQKRPSTPHPRKTRSRVRAHAESANEDESDMESDEYESGSDSDEYETCSSDSDYDHSEEGLTDAEKVEKYRDELIETLEELDVTEQKLNDANRKIELAKLKVREEVWQYFHKAGLKTAKRHQSEMEKMRKLYEDHRRTQHRHTELMWCDKLIFQTERLDAEHKKTSDLQDSLKKKMDEFQEYKLDTEKKIEQVGELKADLVYARGMLVELENANKTLRQSRDRLEKQIKQLNDELAEKKRQIKEKSQQNNNEVSTLADLKNKLSERDEIIAAESSLWSEKLIKLEDELKVMKADKEAHKSEMTILHDENLNIQIKLNTEREQTDCLQEHIKTVEKRLSLEKHRLRETKAQNQDLGKQVLEFDQKIKELNVSYRSEIAELKSTNQKEINQIESTHAEEIAEMQSKLANEEQHARQFKELSEKTKQQLDEVLKEQEKRGEKESKSLESRKLLEKANGDLTKNNVELEKTIADIVRKNESLENEREDLVKENGYLSKKSACLEKKNVDLGKNAEDLEKSLKVLKKQQSSKAPFSGTNGPSRADSGVIRKPPSHTPSAVHKSSRTSSSSSAPRASISSRSPKQQKSLRTPDVTQGGSPEEEASISPSPQEGTPISSPRGKEEKSPPITPVAKRLRSTRTKKHRSGVKSEYLDLKRIFESLEGSYVSDESTIKLNDGIAHFTDRDTGSCDSVGLRIIGSISSKARGSGIFWNGLRLDVYSSAGDSLKWSKGKKEIVWRKQKTVVNLITPSPTPKRNSPIPRRHSTPEINSPVSRRHSTPIPSSQKKKKSTKRKRKTFGTPHDLKQQRSLDEIEDLKQRNTKIELLALLKKHKVIGGTKNLNKTELATLLVDQCEEEVEEEVGKEEIFEVESILEKKEDDGEVVYLIKWKDYPDADNSWEPEESLEHLDIMNMYKGDSSSDRSTSEHVHEKENRMPATKKRKVPTKRANVQKSQKFDGASNSDEDAPKKSDVKFTKPEPKRKFTPKVKQKKRVLKRRRSRSFATFVADESPSRKDDSLKIDPSRSFVRRPSMTPEKKTKKLSPPKSRTPVKNRLRSSYR